MPSPSGWFCALLDTCRDVYFRYDLVPERRFVYVSPSVEAMTGVAPQAFYADADICGRLVSRDDRRRLAWLLGGRRGRTATLRLVRNGVDLPVDVRVVALVRHRRVVAIEGVATLAVGHRSDAGSGGPAADRRAAEPVQQRLTSLMVEVHDLLHRVLPPPAPTEVPASEPRVLACGDLALDEDGLTVTESGREVVLTTREVLLLRYLLQRAGRIVTRDRLLTDVWGRNYTGDDRTVDVHVSRLRRKLPSLRGRLVAIRHLGYRLDLDTEPVAHVANS
jgi:DNA-binding winged helix-turn-helix (wHTH) protein